MLDNGKMQWRESAGTVGNAVFMGDFCPRDEGEEIIRAGKIAEIFNEVTPFILNSDLKIIQWETPMTLAPAPISKCGPNLNCIPEIASIIPLLKIDVALLANNHTGDHGPEAAMETIDRLHQAGAKTVGAGENLAEAKKPLLIKHNGIKIAILNWGENEFGFAKADKPGSNPLSLLKNLQAIKTAREIADQVWVTIHGGHEYNPFPSPRMQETYRAFADAGAALVFNCHTHCPEGIEVWNGTPIIYSPGNFYFPNNNSPAGYVWWTGYLPKVYFDRTGVYALEIEPYHFDKRHLYVLKGADREAFFAYIEEISAVLYNPGQMQDYFETWCGTYGYRAFRNVMDRINNEFPEPPDIDPELKWKWMKMRNLFTCEAHCDRMKCYLRLLEEDRLPEAASRLPYIKALQYPPWLKDKAI